MKNLSILSGVLILAGSITLPGCVSTVGQMVVADQVNTSQNIRADAAQTETFEQGIAKKTTNVRSGPGISNAKIGRLRKGSKMRILDKQRKWLQIEADTPKGHVSGWVYAPLITIHAVTRAIQPATTSASVQSEHPFATGTNRSNVFYAGYAKDFLPVKQMMRNGNLKGIEEFFTKREKKVREQSKTKVDLIKNIGLLRWMERGTLNLDTHHLDKAVESFENAETIINLRKDESQASDFMGSLMSFTAETLTGNEEFMRYEGEGFEKVLMLNYKSIAYLLNGERKAYNTTRRAIDWQNIEKKKFETEIKKAGKKTAEQNVDSGDEWNQAYKKYDPIANKVPSAYVNPFGYYVAGMIQEYESKADHSLRDNARIAYEKALELNPESKVIKQAVKAMQSNYQGNKRLVHIVVADGFVPEKKMLVYNIPTRNGIVPVKLTLYEPVPSKVARVEVQTTSGRKLTTLSTVADIEAITMRHQKDSEGFRALRVALSIARAIGVNEATKRMGLLGSLIGAAVNNMGAPDMRSWMSLPARIQAARLQIGKKTSQLKLVSYDKYGRILSSKIIEINKKSDDFVYARTIDQQMYINTSKRLWL